MSIRTMTEIHRSPSSRNTSQSELPSGRTPVLAIVPMPPDANPHGHVFGGWIMSQMDIAGAVAAVQRARGRVSTVAVNTLTFLAPIQVGSRTLFYADVVRVGNTSVTCKVEAYTEHNIHAQGLGSAVHLRGHGRERPASPGGPALCSPRLSGLQAMNGASF